jgi:glutamate-ammonia-ligase adenylyltransferase
VAVSLESFARYYAGEAWTWERLALTRARVIVAGPRLRERVDAVISSALTERHDGATLLKEARDMREKLAKEFPAKNMWDLKFAPGGLVDIEFIAQALQLREAQRTPAVLAVNTFDALQRLHEAGALEAQSHAALSEALSLQQALLQVLRIAIAGPLDAATASPGLKSLVVRAAGEPSFADVERRLAASQASVRLVFAEIFGA